jgi:hypothetical protein
VNHTSTYYHLEESDDFFVLNDRVEVSWKQILLYPIPLGLLTCVLSGGSLLVGAGFALVFGFLYLIFRYSAWFVYKELRINKSNGEVLLIQKILQKDLSSTQLDKTYSVDAIKFERHERSGQLRYILLYVTHQDHSVMVVKSERDRNIIEQRLKRLKVRLN